MNAARPRGRNAEAEAPRPLRIGAGGAGGDFLVPCLDAAYLVLPDAKGLDDAVDAVAREPEHHLHAPIAQPFDQHVAARAAHVTYPLARLSGSLMNQCRHPVFLNG